MNIIDAVKLLDDVVEDGDYGKIIIVSPSLQTYLVNSKYGICKCGYDWPNAWFPNVKEFMATDWEISKN